MPTTISNRQGKCEGEQIQTETEQAEYVMGLTITKFREAQLLMVECADELSKITPQWVDYVSRKFIFAFDYGETIASWNDW